MRPTEKRKGRTMGERKTGVAEWAPSSCNIQTGCEHACRYCYAREMAVRQKRATLESWAVPVIRQADLDKGRGLKKPQNQPIMFPTTHDITRGNLDTCLTVLLKLLQAGNRVLVVSKMSNVVRLKLAEVLLPYRDQLMFRITLGTIYTQVAAIWEPGAPPPQERLDQMYWLNRAGYRVSVSAEPFLGGSTSPAYHAEHLFQAVAKRCNGPIWFGPMNKIAARVHGVPKAEVDRLKALSSPETLRAIYDVLRDRVRVRFKDGFTKVIDMPPQKDDWPELPEESHG